MVDNKKYSLKNLNSCSIQLKYSENTLMLALSGYLSMHIFWANEANWWGEWQMKTKSCLSWSLLLSPGHRCRLLVSKVESSEIDTGTWCSPVFFERQKFQVFRARTSQDSGHVNSRNLSHCALTWLLLSTRALWD